MDCHGTQNVVVPRNDGKLEDVSAYFDRINWDKLPNAFVIKTNHECKWQYIIKDKEQFLKNRYLFEKVKQNITGWLEQDYSFWGGFELQYKNIAPKILIEPLLVDDNNIPCGQIQIYFFQNQPKFTIKIYNEQEVTIWNEELKISEDIFNSREVKINKDADSLIKHTIDLSIKLINKMNFAFVRVDWFIYKNKPYFEEMTFTPYSGFIKFDKKRKWNLKLGNLLRPGESYEF